jgi:hypothetical protein
MGVLMTYQIPENVTPTVAVGRKDVEVVVGTLAVLETLVITGRSGDEFYLKFQKRFTDADYDVGSSADSVAKGIHDLNQRLRSALGEYQQ